MNKKYSIHRAHIPCASPIRNSIAYANNANVVNKDSPVSRAERTELRTSEISKPCSKGARKRKEPANLQPRRLLRKFDSEPDKGNVQLFLIEILLLGNMMS